MDSLNSANPLFSITCWVRSVNFLAGKANGCGGQRFRILVSQMRHGFFFPAQCTGGPEDWIAAASSSLRPPGYNDVLALATGSALYSMGKWL
jgi:hypothetical protein